ncbi:MAG: hypothetical protein U1F43_20580 [Myxococcota bacterium]
MRTTGWMTMAAMAMTVAACDSGATSDGTTEATEASLSAGAAEGDGEALGSMAFPLTDVPSAPGLPTAADRVQRFKAFVDSRLTCADAVATAGGDGVTVTFDKDCTWAGRRWTGSVAITWDAGGNSADIVFDGVSVSGATLTGDMTVTRVEDGHVTVSADWTRTRGARTIEGSWDSDFSWTDTTYTVNSATHSVKVNGRTATRTSTAVVWQKADPAPESGTVTFSGFRGNTWTMTFAKDESGAFTITVVGPRGTRTFTIGAAETVDPV